MDKIRSAGDSEVVSANAPGHARRTDVRHFAEILKTGETAELEATSLFTANGHDPKGCRGESHDQHRLRCVVSRPGSTRRRLIP